MNVVKSHLTFFTYITYNNFFITILLVITDHSNLPNSANEHRWLNSDPHSLDIMSTLPKMVAHLLGVAPHKKQKKILAASPWLATYRAEKANTVSTCAAALSSSRLPNVSTRQLRPPQVSARPSSSANSQLVLVLVILSPDPDVTD
jgi:hypothetical protein